MEIKEALERVRTLQTPKRYQHTLRVLELALELAERFNGDMYTVGLTAALHDCAKDITNELLPVYSSRIGDFADYPEVIHAPLGALYAQDVLKINDIRILDGIRYHCTGRPTMPLEEKIVYLADALEAGRKYKGVEELRKTLAQGLDATVVAYARSNLAYLNGTDGSIHPLTAQTLKYYEEILK